MRPSPFLPHCRRQAWANAVDRWVVSTYATGVAAPGPVARHLRRCPHCRRRAARAWLFLPEANDVGAMPIPEPDLSFLPPVRPLP